MFRSSAGWHQEANAVPLRSALRFRFLRAFGSTEERPQAAAPRWHEFGATPPGLPMSSVWTVPHWAAAQSLR